MSFSRRWSILKTAILLRAADADASVEASFNSIDPTGRVAAECWSEYKIKLEAWHAHRADFQDALRDWSSIRAKLHSLAKPPELATQDSTCSCITFALYRTNPLPSAAEVQFAFMNAPLIRHRLTLGDLFVFLQSGSRNIVGTGG